MPVTQGSMTQMNKIKLLTATAIIATAFVGTAFAGNSHGWRCGHVS